MAAQPQRQEPIELESTPETPRLRAVRGGGNDPRSPDSDLSRCYTASSVRRILAAIVDGLVFTAAVAIIGEKTNTQAILCLAAYLAMEAIGVALFGQTPGGRLLGLYIVSDKAFSPPQKRFPGPSWIASFVRAIFYPLTCGFLVLSSLGLLNSKRRHLADLISGTRVIMLRPRNSVPSRRWFVFLLPFLLTFAAYGALIYFLAMNPANRSVSGLFNRISTSGTTR